MAEFIPAHVIHLDDDASLGGLKGGVENRVYPLFSTI